MSRKLRAENGNEPEGGRGNEFRTKAGMKEEPAYRRKYRLWTDEMIKHLAFLCREHNMTIQELTESMNERFPEKVFTFHSINTKLSSDIYRLYPELRKRPRGISWTEEMEDHLASLRHSEPRLTFKEMAKRMNERFPGIDFTTNIVRVKITQHLIREYPELRRRASLKADDDIHEIVMRRLKRILQSKPYARYEEMGREAIQERFFDVAKEFTNEMLKLYDELRVAVTYLLVFPEINRNVIALLALLNCRLDYKREEPQWFELPERVHVIRFLRATLEEEDNQGLRELAVKYLGYAVLLKDPRAKEEAEKLQKELKEKDEKNQ